MIFLMIPSHSPIDHENGPRPTWVRWRIVALLVAFSFMTWFNRVSMAVAYDEKIRAELNISEEAMGSVYSTFLVAYMICMTPGGWLIDRFGPRLALLVMGFGSGLFGALTGLAGVPPLAATGLVLPGFFVTRFIMGMLSAPVYPAASRAVSFWVPQGRRTLANGLVQSGAALGIALAFPLFGALIDIFGWPVAFLCTGSFTALVALFWSLYATDHPTQHFGVNKAELCCIGADPLGVDAVDTPSIKTPPNWLRLLRNRSLVFLTISYAALGYMEYLFFFWMHYYFDDVLHMGKAASRVYSMVLFLAFAVGMILGGWVTDRLQSMWGHGKGRAVVPMLGMMAGAFFLWLGLMVQGIDGIVTCLALALTGVGACESAVWTTAVELGGRQGGTAAGICNTGGNLGGLIAPVLTPFLSHQVAAFFEVSDQVGWQWGIGLGGLICFFGAILWLWIDPCER
jgi:ACS family D-galactonate transporter-like MFS transporter